jgi:hypothetical protein
MLTARSAMLRMWEEWKSGSRVGTDKDGNVRKETRTHLQAVLRS